MTASTESARLRRRLVRTLERDGWFRSPRVRDAFAAVPRELFVPEFAEREGLAAVYRNESIVTKQNSHGTALSSSSQPSIMALMLEQLQLEEGMRVLEVGAGTGYNAALLSTLVGSRGRVVSIDVDPELARGARRGLRAAGYKARIFSGDGRAGFAPAAPYDRIIVTASTDVVPAAWFRQCIPGGLLEVPLRLSAAGAQAIALLRKGKEGFRSIDVIAGGFIPLRSDDANAAASLKRTALIASDATCETGTSITELYGEALTTLTTRAKRRLLALALGEPRKLALGLRASPTGLTLFLSLRLPGRNLVTTAPRYGIGATTRNGRSLALIEPTFGCPSHTVNSLSVFGSDDAANLLLRHVREWDQRGRPDASQLAIIVSYDARQRTRVTHRWPTTHR
jgi:protein-L-isoaspartate(D-aspartate) O-methyltransferase